MTSLAFPSLNSPNISQNGLSYGTTLRGEFNLTPRIYFYAEPNLYFRKFESYVRDANGYTANAGVGSHLIGLFSGEIYGGYLGAMERLPQIWLRNRRQITAFVSLIFRLPC